VVNSGTEEITEEWITEASKPSGHTWTKVLLLLDHHSSHFRRPQRQFESPEISVNSELVFNNPQTSGYFISQGTVTSK
jgi:hypothetical protein